MSAPIGDHLHEAVRAWFDVADEALAAQRDLAKAVLSAGDPALDAVARAAHRSAEIGAAYRRRRGPGRVTGRP